MNLFMKNDNEFYSIKNKQIMYEIYLYLII